MRTNGYSELSSKCFVDHKKQIEVKKGILNKNIMKLYFHIYSIFTLMSFNLKKQA